MYWFDPMYLLFIGPAVLLGFVAQMMVRSAYASARQQPSRLSGVAAARHVLDSAGLQEIGIEMIPGQLSDHYDPRHKVLRLSQDVYNGRNLAAVGIAAHEAGHAIQDARHYAPLVVRNLAVPVAGFGSQIGGLLLVVGLIMSAMGHAWQPFGQTIFKLGVILFGTVVVFQVVNLPVEFDASARAKAQLVSLGIVDGHDMGPVRRVLRAAALTYVAATLQAILTLAYYVWRMQQQSDR